MLPVWSALQLQRWFVRWPAKWLAFGVVVFVTLFPNAGLFWRHLEHIRTSDQIADPNDPALVPVRVELLRYLDEHRVDRSQIPALLKGVERFVYARIPYAWDWDTWGVADYLPTVSEIMAKGREDCDGRAVLAAALVRSLGLEAHLVADPRHVWVHTAHGELMNPLGRAVFEAGKEGVRVRWAALLDPGPFAFGLAVFPLLRELIILLAAWLLLLSPRMNRVAAALVLLLLLESLMLVRLAGANPLSPRYVGLAAAAAHWPVVLWFLLRQQRRAMTAAVDL